MTSEPTGLAPGPQEPLVLLPALTTGAARRTTTIDTLRPEGPTGPAAITLRGRDVVVDADGHAQVRAEATFTVEVSTQGQVERIDGDLPGDRLAPLTGQSLRAGFGALVARHLGDELAHRSLAGVLLEDLAGAYFVSGTVLIWADLTRIEPSGLDYVVEMQTDVCAGWRQGAQQQVFLVERSALATPGGPPAPDLEEITGAPGRHPAPSLPPHAHRRARLLDVVPTTAGRRLVAHFRDSVRDADRERVLHEYRVDASVGADDVVTAVEVDDRVLPWAECPAAVASGERAEGRRLADLPRFARAELVGTSTCTHLNGTVRSLADATALSGLLTEIPGTDAD